MNFSHVQHYYRTSASCVCHEFHLRPKLSHTIFFGNIIIQRLFAPIVSKIHVLLSHVFFQIVQCVNLPQRRKMLYNLQKWVQIPRTGSK